MAGPGSVAAADIAPREQALCASSWHELLLLSEEQLLRSESDFFPWRMRERTKTVAIVLVLALNIGVDRSRAQKS